MALQKKRRVSQLKKLQFTARKLFKPVTVSYAGLTFWTGAPSLPSDIRKALYKECHEHLEHQLAAAAISPEDRVLEIGAGVGLVSLVCARICGVDSVLSYEANPKMADIIHRNFELNGMSANLRNKAVAKQSGEIDFYFNDNVVSSSIIDRGFGKATPVPCDGFFDVIREFSPTTIVMDAEGAETDLLSDIPLDGVSKILLEVHPKIVGQKEIDDLIANLVDKGLILRSDYSVDNVVFLSRD